MATTIHTSKGRLTERLFLLAISIVLGLLFFELFTVLKRDFAEVPQRLQNGSMINLNEGQLDERVQALLQKGYYLEDRRDIHLIRTVIAEQRAFSNKPIDNIGELNKQDYYVEADRAFANGGDSYKKRVKLSRTLLGFSGPDSNRFVQERTAPPQLPASTDLQMGVGKIIGDVSNREGAAVAGVLVRLEMLLPRDSVYSSDVSEVERERTETTPTVRKVYVLDSANTPQLQSLTAYARTDAGGKFSFVNLPEGKAFDVLPLQPGFQFGSSKGVQALDNESSFTFYQAPHKIRLFSSRDFNNLKKEGSLIVRTPEEATRWYWIIAAAFFLSFFVVHLFLSIKLPAVDQLILPLIMLLVGLSLLTLLSLQDPLRDRFLGRSTLWYFLIGITGLFALLFFNLRRFTTDSGLYRLFLFKEKESAANGWPWAAAGLGLLILTILFGSGPEGSGVKVNLFGFQPSEVVKFLLLLFLAGFFAANEKFIADYVTFKKRWSFFGMALAAIVAAILLFLMLGDLGPAIVICFTFIILFSFSRGDFAYMAGAVLIYILAVWLIDNIWLATGVAAVLIGGTMLLVRKQLSESAIMALVVMAGFLLLDQIPFLDDLFPGPVGRLVDRKAIWLDNWDNEVFGGDQVANGIWAMASGGITGQGIGEGFSKTIPEAHTDMILPSIGEEFGWTGIVCVFIAFLIYLHRAIVIGRQTGTPFLFYLCAGIGISTFVQFLLIAGGSTGVLPLSGISLPFISYGGSSLIINLLAAGFLLSASLVQGTAVQMKFITRQQDRNLVPALIAACVGLLLLTINVSQYLFNNDTWVVKPALVAERSGARMFSYNPRIAILMNRLQAGTLYDRNGAILATSKVEQVQKQQDSLLKAGIGLQQLEALYHKRQDRYYPFAEHMFFWTGDANTGVFNGSTNGYFAEYEHGAALRGFETPATTYTVTANRYREDRFLPQSVREMRISKRDYSALAPLLLAGINSNEVAAFKQRNRDVQLTMDASLQTAIQQSLMGDDSLRYKRVSVVVMQDSTGDVLASAMYPLAPVNDWDLLTLPLREQRKLPFFLTATDLGFTYATQPGSTAKIATALAAFNKLGDAAARKSIVIRPQDLIRIRSAEPDEAGTISMERALVKSNNSYFIKLANEERLQEEMVTLYMQTGMFLRGVGGYYYEAEGVNTYQQNKWRELWRQTEFRSLNRYNKNDIRATRGLGVSGMAWGQGELIATPASVARLASAIANNGLLVPNRYVLKVSDSSMGIKKSEALAQQPRYADIITSYMILQSANRTGQLGIKVAGKTGTPERIYKKRRINDGWYVFFAPRVNAAGHIVVCIRIEDTKGSSDAVRLAGKHVLPKLIQMQYIQGFNAVDPPAR